MFVAWRKEVKSWSRELDHTARANFLCARECKVNRWAMHLKIYTATGPIKIVTLSARFINRYSARCHQKIILR